MSYKQIIRKSKAFKDQPNPTTYSPKKKMQSQQHQWIGDTNQNFSVEIEKADSIVYLNNEKPQILVQNNQEFDQFDNKNKSATQMMQDLLRGLNTDKNKQLNTYYSKNSQQTLIGILTNKQKANHFIKKLQSSMVEVDKQVVLNYQILILLIKQLQKNTILVHRGDNGVQLQFSSNQLHKQQNQIERLQKQLVSQENQIQEVFQQYEAVIRNFNDVIERMVDERDKSKRLSYH